MEAVTPDATSNTPLDPPPVTATELAPGPSIDRFTAMSTAAVSEMGELGGQDTEKLTVSPGAAAPTTAGSDPGPEAAQVVTVSVAAAAIPVGTTARRRVTTPATRQVEKIPVPGHRGSAGHGWSDCAWRPLRS